MAELHWPPSVIRDLTVLELVCLMNDRPPGRRRMESAAEYQAMIRIEAEEERAWAGA
jgi:hypothetical protein